MDTQPAGNFNNEPEPIKSILERVIKDLAKKCESTNESDDERPE